MAILVLLRHGRSTFNEENLFTGWIDAPLSKAGIKDALQAKNILRSFNFDAVFCSSLRRAIDTASLITSAPIVTNSALNERSYGILEGKEKDEMRRKFGELQIKIWRRSYDQAPPEGESLKDTFYRVIPYYQECIEPLLKAGKTVLICSHSNSLRALMKFIEKISDEEIEKVEMPFCIPVIYQLDLMNLQIINKTILQE